MRLNSLRTTRQQRIPTPATSLLVPLAALLTACATRVKTIEISEVEEGPGPSILAVIAHPDDESAFAGAVFASAVEHGSAVDVLCLTNGEGGFKYSTLAEREHGVRLTEEAVGRAELPAIREAELTRALGWLGVRRLLLLQQTDHRYTTDLGEVLPKPGQAASPWDLDLVRGELARLLADGEYELVLALAPSPTTHAHHQAATLLAAEAVRSLPAAERPLLLTPTSRRLEDGPVAPSGLEDQPSLEPMAGPFTFNRRTRFGHRERLDYSIPILWAMAEHRSQGTLQMMVGRADLEDYWMLAASIPEFATADDVEALAMRAKAWTDLLATPTFTVPTYGASAGTNAQVGGVEPESTRATDTR
jgi:LmbE family N-acetylglucosaminyl deacetylase